MKARGAKHVATDQFNEWRQRCGAGADPIGQRRHVEIDALAGEALTLPVQRQVIAELAMENHRQQAGTGPPSGNRMERRRWLGDGLASPAGELLPHGLDHLPYVDGPLLARWCSDLIRSLAFICPACCRART